MGLRGAAGRVVLLGGGVVRYRLAAWRTPGPACSTEALCVVHLERYKGAVACGAVAAARGGVDHLRAGERCAGGRCQRNAAVEVLWWGVALAVAAGEGRGSTGAIAVPYMVVRVTSGNVLPQREFQADHDFMIVKDEHHW